MGRHLASLGASGLLAFVAAGCGDLFGLEGDRTRGDEGTALWSFSDGLCPGFVGDCAVDVPIAVGAAPIVEVEHESGSLAGTTLEGDGVEVRDYRFSVDDEGDVPDQGFATLVFAAEGRATLRLLAGDRVLDSVTVSARTPRQIVCGAVPTDSAILYTFESLMTDPRIRFSRPAEEEDTGRQLGCRVSDESGEPLLSVMAVQWEVLAGSEFLLLRGGEFFSNPSARVNGALITAEPQMPGTARVRASIGEIATELDVVIE